MPVVPCLPARCPSCGQARRETYGRQGRKRYHWCVACRIEFHSIEILDIAELSRPPFRAG